MKKLWMGLSIILALSLVWCAIPAFGGWSWAADPEFLINEATVNVLISVDSDPPDKPTNVHVMLRVPKGTGVEVTDDSGFHVWVIETGKLDDGGAELHVVVPQSAVPGHVEGVQVTVTSGKASFSR